MNVDVMPSCPVVPCEPSPGLTVRLSAGGGGQVQCLGQPYRLCRYRNTRLDQRENTSRRSEISTESWITSKLVDTTGRDGGGGGGGTSSFT